VKYALQVNKIKEIEQRPFELWPFLLSYSVFICPKGLRVNCINYSMGQKNSLHAFGYNSAESAPMFRLDPMLLLNRTQETTRDLGPIYLSTFIDMLLN